MYLFPFSITAIPSLLLELMQWLSNWPLCLLSPPCTPMHLPRCFWSDLPKAHLTKTRVLKTLTASHCLQEKHSDFSARYSRPSVIYFFDNISWHFPPTHSRNTRLFSIPWRFSSLPLWLAYFPPLRCRLPASWASSIAELEYLFPASRSVIACISVPMRHFVYRSLSKHSFNWLARVLGAGVIRCVLSVLLVCLLACLFFLNHEIVSPTNKWNMPSGVYQCSRCLADPCNSNRTKTHWLLGEEESHLVLHMNDQSPSMWNTV